MKIQLKRSNVLDGGSAKEPTSLQMEYGELAVNYNESDPAIFLKDSNDNVIRIAGAGNISNGLLPDTDNDNQQPGTLDDRYVNTVGDNMTGNLTLGVAGNPQITLAADGSATFAGKATSAETVEADADETLVTKGYIQQYISDNTAATIIYDGTDGPPDVADYEPGTLWYDSSETGGDLYVLYEDEAPAAGKKWVAISGGAGGGGESFWEQTGSILSPIDDGADIRLAFGDIGLSANASAFFGGGYNSLNGGTSISNTGDISTNGTVTGGSGATFAGNVGIGTNAPSAKLDVAGNIAATAISGSVVATDAEVEEGTSTTTVITPATLKLALEAMGTTPPDIINEGWPGTNTGMLGFGLQTEYKGFSSNFGHYNFSILSQKDYLVAFNSGLGQTSDIMMRGLEQWTLNSQVIDGSATMIPTAAPFACGDNKDAYFNLLTCPSTLKGKTLDVYISYAKLSSTNSQEETVANLIAAEPTAMAARWSSSGSGQTPPALTVTNTTIYNTGGRNLWVIRKRYTNLPDCCAITFTGPAGSSYSTSYPAVCYYEIY